MIVFGAFKTKAALSLALFPFCSAPRNHQLSTDVTVQNLLTTLCFLLLGAISCKQPEPKITKIAFGSCGNQDTPQPVLDVAVSYKPDLFVFLGDNIYGDTDVMDTLRNKYKRWGAQSHFQNLARNTRILATWDDHDFGRNDSGRHYPYKEASKQIFMDFFREPADSPRRQREGIYNSYYEKVGDKTLQIILLDVRTFRDNLLTFDKTKTYKLPRDHYFYDLDYVPNPSKDSTLLGAAQWAWLEQELSKPADLRIIGSGTQFSIEFDGYEAWANVPHEQQKMLDLIKKTKANGVVFITGDVHYAEISKLAEKDLYPIYDVTASGITSTWDFACPNKNRIEGPVMENHFGLITVDWQKDPVVKMEIIDVSGNPRIEYATKLSALKF